MKFIKLMSAFVSSVVAVAATVGSSENKESTDATTSVRDAKKQMIESLTTDSQLSFSQSMSAKEGSLGWGHRSHYSHYSHRSGAQF